MDADAHILYMHCSMILHACNPSAHFSLSYSVTYPLLGHLLANLQTYIMRNNPLGYTYAHNIKHI